ncbi:MAG: AraC family transcriptional regulator [Vitreimonas sp.]
MAEATIAASFARSLLDFAVAKGADRGALLARSGIGEADWADEEQRLAFAKYMALMRAAKELTGDPALALHLGEAVDMADISIIGLISRTSSDFVEMWAQVNRFHRLGVDVEHAGETPFVVEREPAGVWVIDTRQLPGDFIEQWESFFVRAFCGVRRLTDRLTIREVHFRHRAPAYRAEYERIFRAPVFFESDRNAALLDEIWLSFTNPLASTYAFGALSSKAEAMLASLATAHSARAQVERLLLPMLHKGGVSVELIAQKMGVSRKTLFRRLKTEGVTFKQVLDALRHKMALDYLSARKTTVNETAYLVGFSDPAAFTRAFKRWTGMSPREVRNGRG